MKQYQYLYQYRYLYGYLYRFLGTIRIQILLSLLLLSVPTYAVPLPEIETLDNGLRIAWFISDRLPVVDFEWVVLAGNKDEPAGKSGVSRLVASLLDMGVAEPGVRESELSAQQIAKAIESLGASRAAAADSDFTKVVLHGLAPDAETLLGLLAEMVRYPSFPESEVAKAKDRSLDGWKHVADYAESLADLAYRRAITRGTAYERGDFFSPRQLVRLTRGDLVDFHARHFTPSNSILLVVGRVDRSKLDAKIRERFGSWKNDRHAGKPRSKRPLNLRDVNPAKHPTKYQTKYNELTLIDRPNLTQAQIRIGFHVPLMTDSGHFPLVVANALLGEYFHSRLNTLIRDKLGLTYGIQSSLSYTQELGMLTISSATRNETVGDVISKALDVLRGLKKDPVPQVEVETAKEYLAGGFPLSTSTLESVAERWMTCFLFGLGPNRLNEYVPKIEAVTAAEVSDVVGKQLDLDHLVIVAAGSAKEIEAGLKHLSGKGFRIEVIPAQRLLSMEQRPSK